MLYHQDSRRRRHSGRPHRANRMGHPPADEAHVLRPRHDGPSLKPHGLQAPDHVPPRHNLIPQSEQPPRH
ncbi:hypothetical protein LINPERHAP1_LOCUS33351 [Linum perenne]